jgi:hypothetical protein
LSIFNAKETALLSCPGSPASAGVTDILSYFFIFYALVK